MKIGILSDTHTKVAYTQQVIDHLLAEGAEFFIHAGDIGNPDHLAMLKATKKKYVAVYGNNDAHLHEFHNRYNLVQEPDYFKLDKTTFKLMHLPYYMNADAQVIIFGHTHEFECDFKNSTLFLNPGEACARNVPVSSCAMLDISPDMFRITHYTRPIASDAFDARHFTFERSAS